MPDLRLVAEVYRIPGGLADRSSAARLRVLPQDVRGVDIAFGGTGTVSGHVTVAGSPDAPVSRRVRLHLQRGGRVVRETWSDAQTGYYEFKYVQTLEPYYVVAHDHTGAHQAVALDNVMAE